MDRHHQARGHRLAVDAARLGPQAAITIHDAKGSSASWQGRRRPLPAVGRGHPLRSSRRHGASRRRDRAYPEQAPSKLRLAGGLPRVAELFEARRPKDHAIIAEIDGTIRFGARLQEQAPRTSLSHDFHAGGRFEYLIPREPFHLQDGDAIEKGDYILDGNPAPHDILAIKGVEALASYLVNEIQEVYRLQGVLINDKHIEVIVRQMLQKVEITVQGNFDLHPGRPCRRDHELEEINDRLVEDGKKPAEGQPVCSASPRPRCRRRPSSRHRSLSRRPPGCSPKRLSPARPTCCRA